MKISTRTGVVIRLIPLVFFGTMLFWFRRSFHPFHILLAVPFVIYLLQLVTGESIPQLTQRFVALKGWKIVVANLILAVMALVLLFALWLVLRGATIPVK